MAIDGSLVGTSLVGDFRYDWRAVALYALAVGATPEDLDFIYESRGPLVLPTFAVIPAGEVAIELFRSLGGDTAGALHIEQKVMLEEPLPREAELETRGSIEAIHDYGTMAVCSVRTDSRFAGGRSLFSTEWTVAFTNDGGFRGDRGPRSKRIRIPKRPPEHSLLAKTRNESAALYRLLGDENPVHIDPIHARAAGLESPILHGLCTMGTLTLSIVKNLLKNDPRSIYEVGAHFKRPVEPGEALEVSVWTDDQTHYLRAHTRRHGDHPVVDRGFVRMRDHSSRMR